MGEIFIDGTHQFGHVDEHASTQAISDQRSAISDQRSAISDQISEEPLNPVQP